MMFCSHCGETIDADDNFCSACGTPVRRPSDTNATMSIEVDTVEEPLEDLPTMEDGTGLFVVMRGPLSGSRFLLDSDTTTIGRHPEADLLLDDVTVSRHHAEVRRDPAGLTLVDLGSLNGTYVGDHRIEEHHLGMGDQVQIGRFKLLFVSPDDAADGDVGGDAGGAEQA